MSKRKTTVRIRRINPTILLVVVGVLLTGAVWTLLKTHAYYPAPSASATPSNDSNYTMTLRWSSTYGGGVSGSAAWQISYGYAGGPTTTTYVSSQYPYNQVGGCQYNNCTAYLKNLVCGQNYTFNITGESGTYGGYATTGTATTTGATACPTPSISKISANGNNVNVVWTAPSFANQFRVEASTGGGYSDVADTYSSGGGSATFSESCGQSVTVYVLGTAGSQSSKSSTRRISTSACATPTPTPPAVKTPTPTPARTPTPTPPPNQTPTPTPTSGGGSGGGGGGGGTKYPTNGTPPPIIAPVPQAPAAPSSFEATVAAGRIVELSWTPSVATSPITAYVLERSTDNIVWNKLTDANGTSYEDDATDYSTIYYYRVKALDSAGNASDYATTQVVTHKFQSTGAHIVSNDGLVAATISDNTFDEEAQCTITKYSGTAPAKLDDESKLLIGPYNLLCIGQDGARLTAFNQPVAVSMKLGDQAQGHNKFTVQNLTATNTSAKADIAHVTTKPLTSTYQPKAQTVSFKLAKANPFGVYGQNSRSLAGIIWGCLLALLALGGLTVGFRFLQGRVVASHDAAVLTGQPGQDLLTQALNRPDCSHINLTHQVQPMANGCQECLATGQQWRALRICLTCGHVGCSDDSPNHHAHQHFEQTGHPIIMAYNEPAASGVGWCYIDQTYV